MKPGDKDYGQIMSVDGPVDICTWCLVPLARGFCPVHEAGLLENSYLNCPDGCPSCEPEGGA